MYLKTIPYFTFFSDWSSTYCDFDYLNPYFRCWFWRPYQLVIFNKVDGSTINSYKILVSSSSNTKKKKTTNERFSVTVFLTKQQSSSWKWARIPTSMFARAFMKNIKFAFSIISFFIHVCRELKMKIKFRMLWNVSIMIL